ncbi:MAG: hypothetical protein ACXVPP_10305 [Actinomycetota bacterium]
MLGFAFHEVMEGTIQMSADPEGNLRPFRFDFKLRGPTMLLLMIHWLGRATGTVTIGGLLPDAPATGELETFPARGFIRYSFDFAGPAAEQLHFEGRKKIRFLFFGWTVLHGTVADASGTEVGRATVRFSYLRHFPPLVLSFRPTRRAQQAHG